jgi:hypothetical protein
MARCRELAGPPPTAPFFPGRPLAAPLSLPVPTAQALMASAAYLVCRGRPLLLQLAVDQARLDHGSGRPGGMVGVAIGRLEAGRQAGRQGRYAA